MRYFTSDIHFDDPRLNLYSRDLVFKSAEECDNNYIKNWNALITDKDTVFVIGDVAMTLKGLEKVKQLKGKKILIKGNYDEKETSKYDVSDELLLQYFDKVITSGYITINNEKVFLNHYPINGSDKYFNLVGHIHGLWKVQRNMINVSMDCWHFTPISEDVIIFTMNAIRKYYDQNVFSGELECNLKFKK